MGSESLTRGGCPDLAKTVPVAGRLETLDELLAELCRHGTVDLFQADDNHTWSAKLTLPVTNPRHESFVCSGFGHSRPHDALRSILEALRP